MVFTTRQVTSASVQQLSYHPQAFSYTCRRLKTTTHLYTQQLQLDDTDSTMDHTQSSSRIKCLIFQQIISVFGNQTQPFVKHYSSWLHFYYAASNLISMPQQTDSIMPLVCLSSCTLTAILHNVISFQLLKRISTKHGTKYSTREWALLKRF